jgi:hypothetical protein
MAEKHPKRPRDINQWAKHMVDLATSKNGPAKKTTSKKPRQARRAKSSIARNVAK